MPEWLVGPEAYCDFATVQGAVEAAERVSEEEPVRIYILSGVYREPVRIYRSRLRLTGIGPVEITMDRCAKDLDERGREIGTFATPTLFLGGSELILENLTVSNTAGQGDDVGQALAVYAHCDKTLFLNCTFKGHQDTLCTGPLPPAQKNGEPFGGIPLRNRWALCRQLYRQCRIEGTVDFIFGGAAALFERCEIRSLPHAKAGQPGYITAASTPEGQPHGFTFRDCWLTAAPGVPEASVYLGRPWRKHAQTVFVNCRHGGHIHPRGWDNWGDPANEPTVYYGEFGVSDADRLREQRVPWAVCSGEDGTIGSVDELARFFEETTAIDLLL